MCYSDVRVSECVLVLEDLSVTQLYMLDVAEYAGSIGDVQNNESQTREQERILELVDRF